MLSTFNLLKTSIEKLDNWINKNGWAGYDPYDIQCAFFFHKLAYKNKFFKKLHGYLFYKFNTKSPIFWRKFFGIKPQINPKGMGILILAYCNLFRLTENEFYLKKAKTAANWLISNQCKDYTNSCWGYPFDWLSLIFIPQNTPSAVVTSHIGHGFWELYQLTKEQKYLDICQSICLFFLTSLNRTQAANGICFSYTPLDKYQVHNANLFVAEFLIRVGYSLKKLEWIKIGFSAANFSLAEQNKDGFLNYWSNMFSKKLSIPFRSDHYHAGFEIRMLFNIYLWTKDSKFLNAVKNYYNYYKNNFFYNNFAPKLIPKGKFDIEIHACAEALLVNAILSKKFPEARNYLYNTINWIIPHMQTNEGWFRFRLIKKKKKIISINIPFMRWGQSWMLYGLSHALEVFKNK